MTKNITKLQALRDKLVFLSHLEDKVDCLQSDFEGFCDEINQLNCDRLLPIR